MRLYIWCVYGYGMNEWVPKLDHHWSCSTNYLCSDDSQSPWVYESNGAYVLCMWVSYTPVFSPILVLSKTRTIPFLLIYKISVLLWLGLINEYWVKLKIKKNAEDIKVGGVRKILLTLPSISNFFFLKRCKLLHNLFKGIILFQFTCKGKYYFPYTHRQFQGYQVAF